MKRDRVLLVVLAASAAPPSTLSVFALTLTFVSFSSFAFQFLGGFAHEKVRDLGVSVLSTCFDQSIDKLSKRSLQTILDTKCVLSEGQASNEMLGCPIPLSRVGVPGVP